MVLDKTSGLHVLTDGSQLYSVEYTTWSAPGGALMKFLVRFSCILILVGTCAFTARASATDPTVNINYGHTPCVDLTPDSTGTASLSEVFPFTGCIDNTSSTTAITTFDLTLTDIPNGTSLSGQSNVFANIIFTFEGSNGTTFNELIAFTGTGPCNFNDSIGGTCLGLTPTTDPAHDSADVFETPTVEETPEPASLLLFGTGFIAIFLVAKRWPGAEAKLV